MHPLPRRDDVCDRTHVDRHGYHLLLHSVPAWVCGQCGGGVLESRNAEAIQDEIEVLDLQARRLAAAVAATA